MPDAPQDRKFSVHARHIETHHARVIHARDFALAAIIYVEDYAHGVDDQDDMRVIVRDIASGHEQCFHVHIGTGEASACA